LIVPFDIFMSRGSELDLQLDSKSWKR